MVKVYLGDESNGILLANQENPPVVEGNYYFSPDAITQKYFTDSNTHTVCGWKGTASYYNLKVGETDIKDAAWYYPDPSDAANHIKGHVAFYKSKVTIKAN